MFRQFTHIILAIFLLLITIGITISMHYCGGNLVSTSINKEAQSCCDATEGCCENKSIHLEVKDDYVSPIVIENSTIVELDILFSILFVSNIYLILEAGEEIIPIIDTSPPPTIQTRLSLLQTYLC